MPERMACGFRTEPAPRTPEEGGLTRAEKLTGFTNWAGRLPGGDSTLRPREPGLKAAGSCADGAATPPRRATPPTQAPGHAPSLRRPRRAPIEKPGSRRRPGTLPLPSSAPSPRAWPARRSGDAPRVSPTGSRRQPPIAPLRPCCRRAGYVRFSNQLELSRPPVSSWAADEPAPPCARALRCGAVRSLRARARPDCRARGACSAVTLLREGISAGHGGSLSPHPHPPPGRSPRFWNVLRLRSAPHHHHLPLRGGDTRVGCPRRPCPQLSFFPAWLPRGGFPGPLGREKWAPGAGSGAGGLPFSPHPSRAA